MYHSIDRQKGDRLTITPDMFAQQMSFLAENAFNVVSLEAAIKGLSDAMPLHRSIVLTFDDGYRDFLTNALPVLDEYRYPATLFVVTQADKAAWRSKEEAKPLLTRDELVEIKKRGISLGSHTATHCDLTSVNDATLERELADSYAEVASFGETFIPFAYPGGTFSQRERDAVEWAGYDCGVIVGGRWGNGAETDRFLLKREPMLASDSAHWFQRRVSGFYEAHYLMARARGVQTR